MPGADRFFKLADALGVSPRWLITGEGPRSHDEAEPEEPDWLTLPRYDLWKLTPDDAPEPIGTERVRRDWISRATRSSKPMWVADLPSDAMSEIGVEGDTVVCEEASKPFGDNRVYIFLMDGSPVVRRVQARPDGILLKADDPTIEPIAVAGADLDSLVAVGRVLAAINLKVV